jgi:FkbM family methyltransferase
MKSLFKRALQNLGWELRRYQPPDPPTPNRCSFKGCLTQAQQNGLKPKTVLDVGVATGTPELYQIFPEAFHLLIEPLEENKPYLETWKQKLRHCEYILGAATQTSGHQIINVHPDLVGSSLYKETEGKAVDGIERKISTITLDQACQQFQCSPPYLIKVDTQGSELDVLAGASQILATTDLIILEVSFFEFFQGAPIAQDYFKFLQDRGFVIYDIFDISYRLLDRAMSQANIAFVQEKSIFRQEHIYATPEQRQKQNTRILNEEYSDPK